MIYFQQAFTLIELMIVVVIIGILATLSIPAYQHYTLKARFADIIVATEPYKIAIALNLQLGEPIKNLNSGQKDIPPDAIPTQNLASLTVSQGEIRAKSTELAGNYTYVLKPDADGSHWKTSGSCVAAGICPAES